jgi:uncharacterized phage protein (TIGR02216 family)
MNGMDWPGLLRVGLYGLRLTPKQFWRLTPQELRVMLGEQAVPTSLTRARLEDLARAFPDTASPRPDAASPRPDTVSPQKENPHG